MTHERGQHMPMMDEATRNAIEEEMCTCLHTKADHHGARGDGACSVTVLSSNTFAGQCKCERFTWKGFIWRAGFTPGAKVVQAETGNT